MSLYPAFLALEGQRALIVGGGKVGLRKAQGLLEAGARITVVSPAFLPEFAGLPLERLERPFAPQDLEGVRLVFACTNVPELNDQISALAREQGLLCNNASQPENGDLRLGAVHRTGGTVAAFSSGTELPLLAQALRDTYAMALPVNLGGWLERWEARREAYLALGGAPRKAAMDALKREIRDALLPDPARASTATCPTGKALATPPHPATLPTPALRPPSEASPISHPDLIVVGLNHKTAPLSIRERLSIPEGEESELLEHLKKHAREVVVLSTCNRTEVYLSGVQGGTLSAFEGAWGIHLRPYLYRKRGLEALHHLFRVSSGLDSLVLGETQIQGQVKRAWQAAHSRGHTGPLLNKAFQMALEAGKEVRSKTGLGDGAVSVSYAAVQLAERVLGSLEGKTALVVGAGETAELTLTHLRARGVGEVYVVNRTVERAQKLAEQWGGHACAVERLMEVLPHADVLIASSAAPHYVVQPHRVSEALRERPERPMFLIDISVPRIIDPEVGGLEGAYLYNLDDLTRIVEAGVQERRTKLPEAEALLTGRLERFEKWLGGYEQREQLRAEQERRSTLVQEELSRLLAQMPDLDGRGRNALEEGLSRLAARLEMGQNRPEPKAEAEAVHSAYPLA